MARAVIVSPDQALGRTLTDALAATGRYAVEVCTARDDASAQALDTPTDVVVCDHDPNAFDCVPVLDALNRARRRPAIVVVSSFNSSAFAVDAMTRGAVNVLAKPVRIDDIVTVIDRALEQHSLHAENTRLRKELAARYQFGNLLGKSAAMQQVFDLIERIAPTSSNVLILGESGSGKELVARALHFNGPRAKAPFIPINCAAMPEGLLESELFGHVRGAFTGATASHRGLLLEASGGALFLDEIGDMGVALQAKLLRVLEDKAVRPVGGADHTPVDVRVISATHRDLRAEVEAGRFREDLFYRLNVIPIAIPPLRERREDIPVLANFFLHKYADEHNPAVRSISREAMRVLMDYPWPGNVRELENTLERAIVLARGSAVGADDLAIGLGPSTHAAAGEFVDADGRWKSLGELEDAYIEKVLQFTGGNKNRAADILGVNRRTLYRWEKRRAGAQ